MPDRFIPYGRQSINDEDVAAVTDVLRSDFLTQGPAVPRFEAAISAAIGGDAEVLAVNSATSALHLAALALGLGPGDCLWTVPNTFIATANCARYCGAHVDFVDIDARTYTIDVQALDAKLAKAATDGTLPKIVAAVDFAGQPCDWDALVALKQRYGFALIDDASHALGATYNGRSLGSLEEVDATIFSFHPVKIVATGEGGAVATSRPEIANAVRKLRTHGIVRGADLADADAVGPWYYEQHDLGFNYRLTDLQAALGVSQMSRLPLFLERRRSIAARYGDLLAGLPVRLPHQRQDSCSSWHLYVVQVPASERRRIFEGLRQAGVGVQVHYIPVHLQPYYRNLGFGDGDFPVAESYYAGAISLPIFPDLTEDDQCYVVEILGRLLKA